MHKSQNTVSAKNWRLGNNPSNPRARWLGIFLRRVPLNEHGPGCLDISDSRCDETITLSPGEPDLTISLTIQPQDFLCQMLSFSAPFAIHEQGTVVLADVSANGVPVADAILPSSVADQIWNKIKLHADEPDIPLARRLAYLLQIPEALLLLPQGPLQWSRTPFPYQIYGIRTLVSRDALLLADDMGLGKTFQAIAAMRILIHRRSLERALIVVPAGLVSQWHKELRFLAPELRVSTVRGPSQERVYQWAASAHVYLVSYETLRIDCTANPQSPPRRRNWDLVIIDEAQKIKNRDTDISRKCKSLPRHRAWTLTGTPLENSPDDLASILEFTRPLGRDERPGRFLSGPSLLKIHRGIQLRRKKADVLPDLPPKTISTLSLPLARKQRETYDRAEKEGVLELRERGTSVKIENVLELILRLKQICNFCHVSGQSSKIEDVAARLATLSLEGHRAIVFSQFTDDRHGLLAIARRLVDFQPLVFTGDLSAKKKDEVIEAFKSQSHHKVLLLSLRAGGHGLNLQEASYVFHFDRWWNPAVEHQANDRSHRLGQTLPVHIYRYSCEETIEEKIDSILRSKQRLFDDIVDDVSIDFSARLTGGELFGLFGLTPPESDGGHAPDENSTITPPV